MVNKRTAGRVAQRKARKTFRTAIRKPKTAVAKLYAAKVGKSVFNRLTKRVGARRKLKRAIRRLR